MTYETWLNMRWKARYDLEYLCKEILNFPDVCRQVHAPVLDIVQKFALPPGALRRPLDGIEPGQTGYTTKNYYKPYIPMYDLPGKRRILILDSRGMLKTTINATAHTIQWLLNYPAMAIWVCQSTLSKAESIVSGIKEQFQYNKLLRELFPEMCPAGKVENWGNRAEFELPCRRAALELCPVKTRREPSVLAGTLDAGSAGLHFDLIKFSDIVEDKNTLSAGQILNTIRQFNLSKNLLVSPRSWMDVEGTRYNNDDLYGTLVDKWLQDDTGDFRAQWNIMVRGIYKQDVEAPIFSPDEIGTPYLLDDKGMPLSWWPERFSTVELEREKKEDPWGFACQKLNNPSDTSSKKLFPLDQMVLKTRNEFKRTPMVFHTTTIDLAETDGRKSDYTVMTTCAWSREGKCYVHDIVFGRFTPDQIIEKIFYIHGRYHPMSIAIEETGYTRGLMQGINRYGTARNIYPNFRMLKRDTSASKRERIQYTLQPWYNNQELIFVDDLMCMPQLRLQLDKFPHTIHDDILDTLADQFAGREYFGRLSQRAISNPMNPEEQQIGTYFDSPNAPDVAGALFGSWACRIEGTTEGEISQYDGTGGL